MIKFVLKWLINGVIVVAMLMFYADVSFINAAITGTVLTLITYYVGDQLILRSTNNSVATISDAVMSFLILWLSAKEMGWTLNIGEILIMTAILCIAEWFLHRHVFKADLAMSTA
ncbi:DUF2512 family protein [Paenibacillaceae bacterium]|nr:DUF2512 family protein [Paenibacillaceae bacterium]